MKLFIGTLILLLFLLYPNHSFAQDKFTISGYVRDGASGEELIGVNILVDELKTGTATNIYGFYSITLSKGTYNLTYSFLGFETIHKVIDLDKNHQISLELNEKETGLKEVIVTGERVDENVRSNEMSIVKLNVKEIKTLPVLFGEVDVLKTIALLPGVSTSGEGGTGLYVRGGGPDQNLILLDEAPVYNASHLLGFFSIFNSDAIKDVKLYKGGIPAQYGGRLSSVLDVKMNEGNSKKYSATGGIGLISSRLTIEGPLVKNKSSFILSGRRTYADLFLKLSKDTMLNQSRLYFYDFNVKANYRFSEKDRVFVSGYFGRDVFGFSDIFGFDWGNSTGTLRWNHLFNEKLFKNTMLLYSNYNYTFSFNFDDEEIRLISGIKNVNLKTDLNWFPNLMNNVKFGASFLYHIFEPPSFESAIPGFELLKIPEKYALESGAYFSNEQTFSDRLSANYGLRFSAFSLMGPVDNFTYNSDREFVIDTTSYGRGQIFKTYPGLEPRASFNYLLTKTSSVKLSYNRTRQYIHLLSNSSAGSPTDLWIPSSSVVQPQVGDQVAVGYFRNFKNNIFETSVEVYYKYMQNQIDYKNGANIVFNPTIETELLFGRGRAYGVELFINKKVGRLTGWFGYTLARSERQIDQINNGDTYPAKYDRTHDVEVVVSYTLSKRIKVAGTWVYATGNAVTFPVGKYVYDDNIVSFYTERNGYRMPNFHRMDLSITLENKPHKKFDSSWNLSIYNAYLRQNAYAIQFRQSSTDPTKTEAVQIALFSIIPSITWNFKF
ncbi:MAG: TonB-dependent receptor [Bacteroidetes bacterium]|nr:TonB-dependent receptor [Bacteroidota bacterium]